MKRALVVASAVVVLVLVVGLVPASFVYDPDPLVRALRDSAQLPIPAAQPRTSSLILANVRIVGGDGSPTSLRIENGTIARIGPDAGADLPVRDVKGAFVMPGLTDAHVHLSMAPGAAVRLDDAATSFQLRTHHLRAYLASGVTTILDPAVDPDVARHIQKFLAAGHPGPRYVHLGPPFVVERGYVADLFPTPVSDAASTERHALVVKESGAVGSKLPIEPGPFLSIWNTPSEELLGTIARTSRAQGLPLYVHAMNEAAFRKGLALEPHAFVHHTGSASDELVARTAERKPFVVSTLAIWDVHRLLRNQAALDEPQVRRVAPPVVREGLLNPDRIHAATTGLIGEVLPVFAGRWSDVVAWFQSTRPGTAMLDAMNGRTLASASDGILRMHRAGIPIVVGSDAGNWPVFPYYLHGSSTLRELELLVKAGLSPVDVVRAATETPARMLGLQDEIGTVAVGKRADLVVTPEDPSRDVGALHRISLVVRDGDARTPDEWMVFP